MRSAKGSNPTPEEPVGVPPQQTRNVSASRERALIMAAFNQVDKASTWTTRKGSNADSTVSPDAPTAAESSHPSLPRHVPLPGPDMFPGYEIKREIHRGGQGVVYLANQLTTKRRVAIKVMHGGATIGTTGKARFDREVQLLGQLNHPNVVKLHDSGMTNDGSLFCVMDYISGKALDEVLREQKREARRGGVSRIKSKSRSKAAEMGDVDSTLEFFGKICDGVNAAHLKGVVHRDIKPANVRVDQSGVPILVDFGLAKVTAGVETDLDPSNPMTMTGQFIGSLPWASPEQAIGSGDAIDLRTDVYSLGVMLYQMLTGGRFPYNVIGNMRDVLDNIQRVEPARPSTIRRQINDEVETIVLKALAKDRERRYQSAGELARDIRHYLAGEPIQAKRDSGWYVIRKTMNRHKPAVIFAAASAVFITGSAIAMTGLWSQAENARGVAVVERDRAEESLDQVRDMAQTFLYDFSDSIENLRGATDARGIVLEKAIQYLGILAAQPDPDDDLLLDLAEAHDRVGDLAGGMYRASTGTTVNAMEHYQSALAIREDVATRAGMTPEMSRLLAGSYMHIGESFHKSARFERAIEQYQLARPLAASSDDQELVGSIEVLIADTHRRMARDTRRDEAAFDAHVAAAELIYSDRLNLVGGNDGRDAGRLLGKLGQLRIMQGTAIGLDREQADEGLAVIAQGEQNALDAISLAAALQQANPADYELSRDLWLYTHHAGLARFESGRVLASAGRERQAAEAQEGALAMFRQCETLAGSMAMDASNLEAMRDLAISMNKVGNTLLAVGDTEQARNVFARNAELWRSIVVTDPVARHLRDLGVGLYKVSQADEARAGEAGTDNERRALLELSLAGYRETASAFQEYRAQGGNADRLLETVETDVARVREALGG